MKNNLESVGITGNESKIYLALLDLGFASVTAITKSTGLHRRNVYDALSRLSEKGMVSSITLNKVQHFAPAHPKRLLEIVKEKEEQIMEQLPALESKFHSKTDAPVIKVFKGAEGLKNLFEDLLATLDKNDNYYMIGGIDMPKYLGRYMDNFHKKRVLKKIMANDLFAEEKRAKNISQLPLTKVRILPKELHCQVQITVYKNKVHQIILSDEIMAIQVTDEALAKSFRIYFDYLWKQSKEIRN